LDSFHSSYSEIVGTHFDNNPRVRDCRGFQGYLEKTLPALRPAVYTEVSYCSPVPSSLRELNGTRILVIFEIEVLEKRPLVPFPRNFFTVFGQQA
jgi:hypothetical protein